MLQGQRARKKTSEERKTRPFGKFLILISNLE
jgi:hypothetical protein